ncbi:MAG: PEGA domain-containing protein [Chthoniobacterales bacterium]|nr:PEGA domain-containing protein [Chthoniobacterales bacterium]
MKAVLCGLMSVSVLLSGCASAPEPEVRTAEPVKTIDIRSWPSGLVVELNGEYVGTTPLELVVETTRYGVWTADYGRGFSPIILRASTADASGWEHLHLRSVAFGCTRPIRLG